MVTAGKKRGSKVGREAGSYKYWVGAATRGENWTATGVSTLVFLSLTLMFHTLRTRSRRPARSEVVSWFAAPQASMARMTASSQGRSASVTLDAKEYPLPLKSAAGTERLCPSLTSPRALRPQ